MKVIEWDPIWCGVGQGDHSYLLIRGDYPYSSFLFGRKLI